MWALNIPAMRIILILQACQLYHTSFYSRELSFFILVPQTPALGDEQAKCIFKFLDTLCVPYAEFKQYFFYLLLLLSVMSSWLLLQWKGSAFMSIKCNKIAACCPVITVLLAASALYIMESLASIAHLLTGTPIRYLLQFSVPFR